MKAPLCVKRSLVFLLICFLYLGCGGSTPSQPSSLTGTIKDWTISWSPQGGDVRTLCHTGDATCSLSVLPASSYAASLSIQAYGVPGHQYELTVLCGFCGSRYGTAGLIPPGSGAMDVTLTSPQTTGTAGSCERPACEILDYEFSVIPASPGTYPFDITLAEGGAVRQEIRVSVTVTS